MSFFIKYFRIFEEVNVGSNRSMIFIRIKIEIGRGNTQRHFEEFEKKGRKKGVSEEN